MGAAKPKPAASSPAAMKIARLLLRQPYRSFVLTGLVVVLSIGAAIYAWKRWGEPATPASEYEIAPEQISVTQQPAWIKADVKAEVVTAASLSRLDVRDPKLVERVAAAFALHPWVAKVERVEKRYPPGVDVRLQYRRPSAVVEFSDRGEAGLLFIDAESVLLPSSDFSPNQARDYLRIASEGETPAGMYGTPWGSERIAGAARIAAAWGERFKPLALYRIVSRQTAGATWEYELQTKEGAAVVWGAAPGHELAGEPSAADKIAALERYVEDKGPLEKNGAVARIDVRELVSGE